MPGSLIIVVILVVVISWPLVVVVSVLSSLIVWVWLLVMVVVTIKSEVLSLVEMVMVISAILVVVDLIEEGDRLLSDGVRSSLFLAIFSPGVGLSPFAIVESAARAKVVEELGAFVRY